jgi:thiamine pyrophosphate-dependent acetolactate synthase large subunit-like protein
MAARMYTCQALWTMAREKLDVTTIILNNGSYAILNIELMRVGVQNPGPKALSMLDLKNPGDQLEFAVRRHGRACGAGGYG